MKRTSLVVAGFSAMVALGLIGYGCTSGDTVNNGTGGKGAGGSTTGAGGSTTTGSGGSTTTGAGGSTTTGAGGSTTTGAGGSTTTGAGGSTTTGAGGSTTTGAGGSSGGLVTCPSPAPGDKTMCDLTAATTVTPCTKNCGIKNSLAQKPCACIASTVMPPTAWDCSNQGPCMYPSTFDKTCYSLATAPPACPTPLVTGLTTCTNTAGATCGPLCGSATVASYSTGTLAAPSTPKPGYCACTNGLWQCASVAEWPM